MPDIKVLHLTTHDEICGIGKYQEQYIKCMNDIGGIKNDIFNKSPNLIKKLTKKELELTISDLCLQMKDYDILHIQHEFSFFSSNELELIISRVNGLGKKIVVTIHTTPSIALPPIVPMQKSLRGLLVHQRSIMKQKKFRRMYTDPLMIADLVMAHNNVTKNDLIKFGVNEDHIKVITMPVQAVSHDLKTNQIATQLHKQAGDVIFCTVGFISKNKGIEQAIKSLSFLPANYKLAIIGGIHPQAGNGLFYDEMCDLINSKDLNERVFITGYIEDDNMLNALIRECDLAVYPYDPAYYYGVSSASLASALANYMPVIAYPTASFKEMVSEDSHPIYLCKTPNYYELAKDIQIIDLVDQKRNSEIYAKKYTWANETVKLVDTYKYLLNN